jgi:hypothetical protein
MPMLMRSVCIQESLAHSVGALQRVIGLGFFMEQATRRLGAVMERAAQREQQRHAHAHAHAQSAGGSVGGAGVAT